jgi:rhodanese-related sulfurtransferase
MVPQQTPTEISQRLQGADPPRLLDVRTHDEHELAHIDGALLVPMNEIPSRIDELDSEASWVVICHHGFRSMQVATWLVAQGFDVVTNLQGGIDRRSLEVDSNVPRY